MYETLTTYNLTAGPQLLVCYANDVTSGLFINMFLVTLWLIIVAGSYMIQKKTTGLPNFSVSLMLGSWIVVVIAIMLRLMSCGTEGLIPNITIAVCVGVALFSIIFLFFNNED